MRELVAEVLTAMATEFLAAPMAEWMSEATMEIAAPVEMATEMYGGAM